MLRARHWQIFLLFIVASFIMQIASWNLFDAMLGSSDLAQPALLFLVVMSVGIILWFSWFWFVAAFLNSVIGNELRPGMRLFALALIFQLLYVVPGMILIVGVKTPPIAIIIPLHLFAMYCMFYVLYYVSRSLVMAESGRRVSFYDFSGPFFLLWFFPIGIWFLQPRINALYKSTMNVAQEAAQN